MDVGKEAVGPQEGASVEEAHSGICPGRVQNNSAAIGVLTQIQARGACEL